MEFIAGVDLGGTNIVVGLLSMEGHILRKASLPTLRGRSYDLIVNDITTLISELIDRGTITEGDGNSKPPSEIIVNERLADSIINDISSLSSSSCNSLASEVTLRLCDLRGIGIGSPGVVDKRDGSIVYSCNLAFTNVPLQAEISKFFRVPIYVDNDANCAALGENFYGAAKQASSSITITIGTGIGGGIVVDGKIYSGFNYSGGEIGHMVISETGNECSCGRRGCWETFASATALRNASIVAAKNNPKSLLNELVGNNLELMNAKVSFDAAQMGDQTALQVLQRYFYYLSVGIINLINIFQPEVVIIGGGISEQGEYLLEPLRKYIEKEVYTRNFKSKGLPQTQIKVAELGNDAGIIGAGKLVL